MADAAGVAVPPPAAVAAVVGAAEPVTVGPPLVPVGAAAAPAGAAAAPAPQGVPAEEADGPLVAADLTGMPWRALQQLGAALAVYRAGMRRPDLEAAILAASTAGPAGAPPATPAAPAPAAAAAAAAAAASPAAAVPVDDLLRAVIARLDRLETAAVPGAAAAPPAAAPAAAVLPPELAAERQYPARVLRSARDQYELDAHLDVARLLWRAQQCVDADEAWGLLAAALDRVEARMAAVLEGATGSWAVAAAYERRAVAADPWLRRHEAGLAEARAAVAAAAPASASGRSRSRNRGSSAARSRSPSPAGPASAPAPQAPGRGVRCFACDGYGHVAKACPSRGGASGTRGGGGGGGGGPAAGAGGAAGGAH